MKEMSDKYKTSKPSWAKTTIRGIISSSIKRKYITKKKAIKMLEEEIKELRKNG